MPPPDAAHSPLTAPAPANVLELVQRIWGFRRLLPLQAEALAAIRAGRDSLIVLPTGGGKSLCYQAPVLLDGGLAVVVSPLISLMKDQVDALRGNGVAAAYDNSTLSPEERDRVRSEALGGRLRLLYASPERLVGEGAEAYLDFLARAGVRYFAIDEAHCISQWGHAFRPEYRLLGALRETFPQASLHGFTATATERVRRDIAQQLGLQHPEILVGSFDSPNLLYRVFRRGDLSSQLRAILRRHPGAAGIVYCISRRQVDRWAERLRDWGHAALPYHAGLSDEERHHNQESFLSERTDVIVATVAFGMGIDRPDVRFVVHAGAPRSLEHYQQESGRAGRDGMDAECALFYSAADFVTWQRLLAGSGELTDGARRLLSGMRRYAGSMRCRHRTLLEYFGQQAESDDCGACDWCLGELEEVEEPLVLAQKILSCVLRLRQRWGAGQVIDVLRGRETDKVKANRHDQLSTFGLLEDYPVGELHGFLEQLQDQGFLATEGDPYPVLRLTEDGVQLVRGENSCRLHRQQRPEPRRRKPKPIADSWDGVDGDLFEALRELRRELAVERGVPPYVILHDRSLRDLARRKPTTAEQLTAAYGIGEKKAADLGERLLAAIATAGADPASPGDDGGTDPPA
jgi:ATP-dependent DNA helicase RecQ